MWSRLLKEVVKKIPRYSNIPGSFFDITEDCFSFHCLSVSIFFFFCPYTTDFSMKKVVMALDSVLIPAGQSPVV